MRGEEGIGEEERGDIRKGENEEEEYSIIYNSSICMYNI